MTDRRDLGIPPQCVEENYLNNSSEISRAEFKLKLEDKVLVIVHNLNIGSKELPVLAGSNITVEYVLLLFLSNTSMELFSKKEHPICINKFASSQLH